MLKSFVRDTLNKQVQFPLSGDQEVLMDIYSEFLMYPNDFSLLLLKGYAGTGKTSMIAILVKALTELKLKTVLLAPTGRAAKVLSSVTGAQATTIHKRIYKQRSSKDAFGEFKLDRNLESNTLFIVDEASMLSDQTADHSLFGTGSLLDDLIKYVYNEKRCKLILVGDSAQLPPVNQPWSKAMQKDHLENYGLDVIEHELKEVIRQEKGSGILINATNLRNLINSEEISQPKFILSGFCDLSSIKGNEILENISNAYHKFGKEDTIIVTRSNKIANKYNQGIRNQILFREEEISSGDYLMVVKNNYFWLNENEQTPFIANGDIAKIKRVKKIREMYGFRFAEADLILPDYNDLELSANIILDTLYSETPALTSEENKKLFYTIAEEEYGDITTPKKKFAKVKENPWFNALQVKFAYAVTCHKSQGGQWSVVFVDQSYFNEDMLTKDYLKWLYTAITRATNHVYLVNFDDNFFLNE
jgi:exodeoxyribonuclease V